MARLDPYKSKRSFEINLNVSARLYLQFFAGAFSENLSFEAVNDENLLFRGPLKDRDFTVNLYPFLLLFFDDPPGVEQLV